MSVGPSVWVQVVIPVDLTGTTAKQDSRSVVVLRCQRQQSARSTERVVDLNVVWDIRQSLFSVGFPIVDLGQVAASDKDTIVGQSECMWEGLHIESVADTIARTARVLTFQGAASLKNLE